MYRHAGWAASFCSRRERHFNEEKVARATVSRQHWRSVAFPDPCVTATDRTDCRAKIASEPDRELDVHAESARVGGRALTLSASVAAGLRRHRGVTQSMAEVSVNGTIRRAYRRTMTHLLAFSFQEA